MAAEFTFFLIAHLYYQQVIEEFNDEPARFGASFPINGLRAFAVMANPSNSCQPIEQPPPVNSTKVPRYVVIISRLIFQSRKFTEFNKFRFLTNLQSIFFSFSEEIVHLKRKFGLRRKPAIVQLLCIMLVAMT